MKILSLFNKTDVIKREDMPILSYDSEKRRLGTKGEKLAVRYLKRHGYRISARNFTSVGAEIDIIAENKDTVAFVEVKTRSERYGERDPRRIEPRPAASVTREKQKKIFAASKFYHPKAQKKMRFDVMEVYLKKGEKPTVVHLPNAFNKNTAK